MNNQGDNSNLNNLEQDNLGGPDNNDDMDIDNDNDINDIPNI